MKNATGTRWWKGARGEWYAAAQITLMVVVFLGPCSIRGWPDWPFPFSRLSPLVGGVLMTGGCLLLVTGGRKLGEKLTPLPRPMDGATLVETGPYGLVRHPMYSGGILLAFGWALVACSWLTLGYALVLIAFLDVKSRREERWLVEKFPTYPDYQRRVRKLVPFVY